MLETNERPGVVERYESACNASSLKLAHTESGRSGGPADVLIASGAVAHVEDKSRDANAARVGMALLRLHSEWSGAAKPQRLRPDAVAGIAAQIKRVSLKSRSAVWSHLMPWAQDKGIPESQVSQALFHWLDPACGYCGGHGLHKAKDAPALLAKQCTKCNGTGNKPIPDGGFRVLSYISHCTSQARTSISRRLQAGRR